MSIIPDYAIQAQEVSRQLESQAMVTANYWSDRKREEFYNEYIIEFIEWLDVYVHGSKSCGKIIKGRGLNDLLQFVAAELDKYEAVSGDDISRKIVAGPVNKFSASQIMVSAKATLSQVRELGSVYPHDEVPDEQSPDKLTENREEFTVDENLNSPGNFSASNLRSLLNKRRNG